jgi:DNA-binding NtrC family response regulator
MLEHPWPGNVRELLNTLLRATVWSDGDQISTDVMRAAILEPTSLTGRSSGILNQPLEEGFSLEKIMAEVARHYLIRAVKDAHGSKTKAAKLVGLSNYQTLTNWMKKYGLEQ